jgi:hypothetical protein
MALLAAADLNDLVAVTLRDLGRLRFQNVAQNLQDYEVFTKWFRKDKVAFDSGYGIQRTLMNALSGAAAHVGLLDEDTVNIPDVIDLLTLDWRHAQTSWAFIYQETLMNRGRAMILNLIEPRRASSLIDLVNEIEQRCWASPGASDKKFPMGVPYWVVKNNTTGFNGGAPSGHSTVGGVSLTDTPNFKNYTAQYTSITKADAVKKLRTAHRKVRFKSPINIQDYRSGRGDRYRVYTNETGISGLEDLGEAQNENLGRDVAALDNTIVFRNHPVLWVPKLDDDTTDPFYMIDHSVFYPCCLKGDYLRESQADKAPNQHNVYQFFVDLTYNILCVDRRRCAVIATNT